MQIQTIVVPTDFSEYAEHAFTWALGLATDRKAKIVLVHAVHPTTYYAFPEGVYLTDFAKLEEELIADARKRLVDFVARKGTPGATVETRVVVGEAVWEICQVATMPI
jgi:nucleotide-binding universal stress UspA family protein